MKTILMWALLLVFAATVQGCAAGVGFSVGASAAGPRHWAMLSIGHDRPTVDSSIVRDS